MKGEGKMKGRWFGVTVLCLIALLVAVGLTQAQEPVAPSEQASAAAPVGDDFTYQGRLLKDGSPVTGNCDFQFQLWDAASGGTQVGTTLTKTNVPVTNGIFTVQLGFTGEPFIGDARWLQIFVRHPAGTGSYQLLSPRQPLTAVPYGLSLKPTAKVVSGDTTAQLAGFYIRPGLPPAFFPFGVYGSSTWGVWGNSSDGLGVRGTSSSGTGVFASSSTGTAIYAAGSGIIKSSAKSYLWISGNGLLKEKAGDSTRWDSDGSSVKIWRGATPGYKRVYWPVTIPAVLFGQPVKLTSLTVYYRCQDGSKNYINRTALYRQTDADSNVLIINDATNRTSNTATSYTLALTTNNTLSADQGGLGLLLDIYFVDDTNYVQIGGIRLELEHD